MEENKRIAGTDAKNNLAKSKGESKSSRVLPKREGIGDTVTQRTRIPFAIKPTTLSPPPFSLHCFPTAATLSPPSSTAEKASPFACHPRSHVRFPNNGLARGKIGKSGKGGRGGRRRWVGESGEASTTYIYGGGGGGKCVFFTRAGGGRRGRATEAAAV